MVFVIGIQAKTTYIPYYRSTISITENGVTKSADGGGNQLSLSMAGNSIKFTIFHEQVTKDKVKSIKSAKSSLGWSTFSVGLNQGRGTTEAMAGAAIINSAKEAADEAQHLSVDLVMENNSDEDVFVGDINKGMGYWHIPAKGNLTVHLNNPDWLQLRVTNAYIHDNIERSPEWKQKVAYVTLAVSGNVEKKNVEYEDDVQIIYSDIAGGSPSKYDEIPDMEYALYDKQTSISTFITKDEYLKIKKQNK